ncbi:hypothetical protein RhiirA5_351594 [Rhizophagus irregularis]|uniref:Uncharacterized protein n=1 Tax=Rhizophagus irregularis TaxID=588596 RepID=A0A2N0PW25_9GLOM|nr:hypothetical protein RhiirA5_354750 [Rhizophagus irregularis]PKC13448.1 hypothetical protein RhiirA5_351594 [Rhizophagus irregularis]
MKVEQEYISGKEMQMLQEYLNVMQVRQFVNVKWMQERWKCVADARNVMRMQELINVKRMW